MDSRFIIGQNKLFARARMHAYEKLQEPFVIAMVFVISFSAAVCATVDESLFVRGKDSRIHAVAINHSMENSTRQKMHVLDNCQKIKAQATALPLIGSDG